MLVASPGPLCLIPNVHQSFRQDTFDDRHHSVHQIVRALCRRHSLLDAHRLDDTAPIPGQVDHLPPRCEGAVCLNVRPVLTLDVQFQTPTLKVCCETVATPLQGFDGRRLLK